MSKSVENKVVHHGDGTSTAYLTEAASDKWRWIKLGDPAKAAHETAHLLKEQRDLLDSGQYVDWRLNRELNAIAREAGALKQLGRTSEAKTLELTDTKHSKLGDNYVDSYLKDWQRTRGDTRLPFEEFSAKSLQNADPLKRHVGKVISKARTDIDTDLTQVLLAQVCKVPNLPRTALRPDLTSSRIGRLENADVANPEMWDLYLLSSGLGRAVISFQSGNARLANKTWRVELDQFARDENMEIDTHYREILHKTLNLLKQMTVETGLSHSFEKRLAMKDIVEMEKLVTASPQLYLRQLDSICGTRLRCNMKIEFPDTSRLHDKLHASKFRSLQYFGTNKAVKTIREAVRELAVERKSAIKEDLSPGSKAGLLPSRDANVELGKTSTPREIVEKVTLADAAGLTKSLLTRLKDRRIELARTFGSDFSRREVARKANILEPRLMGIEHGRNTELVTAEAIAAALGWELQYSLIANRTTLSGLSHVDLIRELGSQADALRAAPRASRGVDSSSRLIENVMSRGMESIRLMTLENLIKALGCEKFEISLVPIRESRTPESQAETFQPLSSKQIDDTLEGAFRLLAERDEYLQSKLGGDYPEFSRKALEQYGIDINRARTLDHESLYLSDLVRLANALGVGLEVAVTLHGTTMSNVPLADLPKKLIDARKHAGIRPSKIEEELPSVRQIEREGNSWQLGVLSKYLKGLGCRDFGINLQQQVPDEELVVSQVQGKSPGDTRSASDSGLDSLHQAEELAAAPVEVKPADDIRSASDSGLESLDRAAAGYSTLKAT